VKKRWEEVLLPKSAEEESEYFVSWPTRAGGDDGARGGRGWCQKNSLSPKGVGKGWDGEEKVLRDSPKEGVIRKDS